MSRCVYCKTELEANCPLDVCQRCGVSVWGEKMFQAIKDNMSSARDKGSLEQGFVTQPKAIQRKANGDLAIKDSPETSLARSSERFSI